MGSRGRSKRAAGVPAPRFAAEQMLDAGHLGQLMRLRLRHLRTELAWWGYAFGTDLAERADLIERIYQLYLVLIAGGSALAAWAMLLARVEEVYALLGPVLVTPTAILLMAVPLVLFAARSVAGLRSSPLKLTVPDASYIASGAFTAPELALTSVVVPMLGWAALAAIASFAMGVGLEAAGMLVSVGLVAGLSALVSAVAVVAADAVGFLGLRRTPRQGALRVCLGAVALAMALGAFAWGSTTIEAMGSAGGVIPTDLLSNAVRVPALAASLPAVLAAMFGLLVLAAHRADLICVIERSGAFASFYGIRHLALTAPTVYRDLIRRQRMAHRRPLRLVPAIGEGRMALISRSAVSHLRGWRGLGRLAAVGTSLVPMGAVVLTGPSRPLAILIWGLLCIMAHGMMAELALAFREDMRVRLVRDALPFPTRDLALLEGVVPAGVVLAFSLPWPIAAPLIAPGSVDVAHIVCGLLLIICFSLAATLDAIEVPAPRRRPSTAAGVLGTAVGAGVLSLAGPEAACLALLIAAAIMFGMLGKAA